MEKKITTVETLGVTTERKLQVSIEILETFYNNNEILRFYIELVKEDKKIKSEMAFAVAKHTVATLKLI